MVVLMHSNTDAVCCAQLGSHSLLQNVFCCWGFCKHGVCKTCLHEAFSHLIKSHSSSYVVIKVGLEIV
jgi:hypothetical protein